MQHKNIYNLQMSNAIKCPKPLFWGGTLVHNILTTIAEKGSLEAESRACQTILKFAFPRSTNQGVTKLLRRIPKMTRSVSTWSRYACLFVYKYVLNIVLVHLHFRLPSPKKYQDQQKGNPCFSRQWRWSWEFPHIGVYKPPLGRQIFKWLRYQSCRFERVGWYKRMHLRQPGPLQHLRSRYHRMSVMIQK